MSGILTLLKLSVSFQCTTQDGNHSMVIGNQGDHLSGKPGNVREFGSCQGNVRDFAKSQGNVRDNLVREKLPKTVYCKVHIFIHTGI